METVDSATEKTWDDDLMKGSNGEVVMGEVMKNQETTSSDMPVSTRNIQSCYQTADGVCVILWQLQCMGTPLSSISLK